jgi:putative ABC transport system permease protein
MKLAYAQLKGHPSRTIWTLLGIILSTGMIVAVFGFAASGDMMMREFIGGNQSDQLIYTTMLYSLGSIFTGIIIFTSVIVISNSFRVSANQRMAQFGILKSVGGTRRQIISIILNEGLFLCLIGIPLGVLLGFLVQFIGLEISNFLLRDINYLVGQTPTDRRLSLIFIVSWQGLITSIVLAIVTVFLSAWLPGRKAAKISAIDAIRKIGEVKITAKEVRGNLLVQKVFGFEGMLASKSLRRSRRSFRATVASLTFSIILFIAATGFATTYLDVTDMMIPYVDSNVMISYWANRGEGRSHTLNIQSAEEITQKIRSSSRANVVGVGMNWNSYSAVVPKDMITQEMLELNPFLLDLVGRGEHGGEEGITMGITLVTIDREYYARLCELVGVPFGSNILINRYRYTSLEQGRRYEIEPFYFDYQTLQLLGHHVNQDQEHYVQPDRTLPLHGELILGEIPNELLYAVPISGLTVLVSELEMYNYNWFVDTPDPSGFISFYEEILREALELDSGYLTNLWFNNMEAIDRANRSMVRMIMTFIYGFVALLTLIALTNVISTISSNIRSRSREFALLQSVGMAPEGLKKMLNLESILCSGKSLIIGLPIGFILTYLIHRSAIHAINVSFQPPIMAMIQSILAVFVITWITMRFAGSRLRGRNLIEEIRVE